MSCDQATPVGSLIINTHGKVYFVFSHFGGFTFCFTRAKTGRLYACRLPKKAKVSSTHQNLPMELVASLLHQGFINTSDSDNEFCTKSINNPTFFSENNITLPGIKNELQPGTVFLDRFRSLHFIYSADNKHFRTLVLVKGLSPYHTPTQMFEFDNLRSNLKAMYARKGIQLILNKGNPLGVVQLLSESYSALNGNISNRAINAAHKHIIADLRTKKDLGGIVMPKYKQKIWRCFDGLVMQVSPDH